MNPPLLWFLVFKHLIRPYGVFLIPAIIAERKLVFLPLTQALHLARTIRADNDPRRPGAGSGVGPGSRKSTSLGDAMSRPYINVVRMHLLIFFFAFCHFLKVDSFLVYAVVYSVYFFPWREVKRLPGGTSVAQPAEIEL